MFIYIMVMINVKNKMMIFGLGFLCLFQSYIYKNHKSEVITQIKAIVEQNNNVRNSNGEKHYVNGFKFEKDTLPLIIIIYMVIKNLRRNDVRM